MAVYGKSHKQSMPVPTGTSNLFRSFKNPWNSFPRISHSWAKGNGSFHCGVHFQCEFGFADNYKE